MDTGIISVRYARALLKCSIEAHVEEHVYHEMQLLASNYLEMPLLGQTIGNPMFAKSTKEAILLAACSEKVTDITKRFIALVLREGRENILPFMARSYIALYRQQRNITQGKLITAATASPKIRQRMQQMVEERTKGTVEFETEVKPEILGGFILEYDTDRLDASVQRNLRTILSQLKHS